MTADNQLKPPPGWPVEPDFDPAGATYFEPSADRRPYEQPERVIYVPGPGGKMVPVLATDPMTGAPYGDRIEPDAPTTPVVVERDVWPARLLSGGGATAAVIGAIAFAGPHLAEAGHAVEMAGIGVAATAAGLGLITVLVKSGMSRKQAAQPNVNVNVTVTNTSSSTSTATGRRSRK